VEHVLHVPGLNKRLLSVREWNHSGGSVTFLADRCRLEIIDESKDTKHTLDINLPFDGGQLIDEVHHADTHPRAKIATTLLHQRLGHRAVSALLLADEDRIWADVDVVPDPEEFCDVCRITTARKANRGSTPLSSNVQPGELLFVDIVDNPTKEFITSNTKFPCYVAITDACSRFFVPIGIQRKDARVVFDAIRAWTAAHGTSIRPNFDLSNIARIHGDFGTQFTSAEFIRLALDHNIRVTTAAPRHQEQNGISEANWRSVRNLAFAMLNQAHMPIRFFHFAFDHAWKVHSVLPHKALTVDVKARCPP
jgi:transposase InsO family protein